ncbi:class I SAM-dependent methyltransferase [[Clostridium] symbiosum]|uniref:class I SAM-dependent methyltransferase n=1 Tax=Clostridium symbiosum TaxID=1512 RepID=UPI00232FD5A7|nr:class I SAM-dependent methyltransferase [[Clostridium] symbiosum]MDB2010487.1 class I SAM-dependent methyltransferase [[Clostridium] symbiosum]MDB2027929.1 class I SAM-dependent methyltransferase [[Clostridium] symbiosum]
MSNYYQDNLNANGLYQVYQTELPRIRQYLQAEIDYVKKALTGNEHILEIGAGYGRIMKELSPAAAAVTGIDISDNSVQLGKEYLKGCTNCRLLTMDAHSLTFDGEFDVVICLQNGLSAVKGNPGELIRGCLNALKPGGTAYFSTYSDKIWETRLDWFREQARKGLLGEVDEEKTKDGVIICKDGFRADTFSRQDFISLGEASGCRYEIDETDSSSLFLIIFKH